MRHWRRQSATGTLIAKDDAPGPGGVSRITRTLDAGWYTAEATTYYARRTGAFMLQIDAPVVVVAATPTPTHTHTPTRTPTPTEANGCIISLGAVSGKQEVNGIWNSSCAATHRAGAYAAYYSFYLSGSGQVKLNLTASQYPYMNLLPSTDGITS